MLIKLDGMIFSANVSIRMDGATGAERPFLVLDDGVALLPEDVLTRGCELVEATIGEIKGLARAGFSDLV